MDGVDGIRTTTRRRTLKERLGLTGMGCCGATWNFRPTTIDASDTEEEDHHHQQEDQPAPIEHVINRVQFPTDSTPDPVCLGMPLTPGGMNLATALAAERHYRAAEGTNNVVALAPNNNDSSSNVGQTETAPGTPMKVSLMRLLAETDGCDGEEKAGGGEVGNDSMCCVCMGRKKGAAFIPCGHTFCRLCSRELWLNRGSCPLCNRSIHEILDIF